MKPTPALQDKKKYFVEYQSITFGHFLEGTMEKYKRLSGIV